VSTALTYSSWLAPSDAQALGGTNIGVRKRAREDP